MLLRHLLLVLAAFLMGCPPPPIAASEGGPAALRVLVLVFTKTNAYRRHLLGGLLWAAGRADG